MDCRQAQQLFDAYLDGELSASLATELGAHRVQCGSCRRALALLEVSGHILRADHEVASPRQEFTDRLLACMDRPESTWTQRVWRLGLATGGLAAAAVVALAFVGVFDSRSRGVVAGERAEGAVRSPQATMASSPLPVATFDELFEEPSVSGASGGGPAAEPLSGTSRSPRARSGGPVEVLSKMLEYTAARGLGALEQAAESQTKPADAASAAPPPLPSAPSPVPNGADDDHSDEGDSTADEE